MPVKLGSFVIPGGSTFSVTGVGFKPRWVIFLFGNKGVEESWLDDACGGIAFTAMQNSVNDDSGARPTIRTTQVSERWWHGGSGAVAGSFLGDVTMWVRATNGSNGWANYTTSLDADGFTFQFDPDFVSGAGGQVVYYLAGDLAYEQVGCRAPWIPGSPSQTLGWEPLAFFGIGAGGNVGGDGGTQSFSLFDRSVPSVCCGDWGEYTHEPSVEQNSQWRSILDPNVNIQHYYGYESSFNPVTIIEPQDSGGIAFSDTFGVTKTTTTMRGVVSQVAGFSDGDARMATFQLGNVDSRIGQFVPGSDIGTPHQVDLGFTPEAVVFFSPQAYHSGPGDPAVQGATGWGFCTEEDEALLIYGGYWNPGSLPFMSNMLLSRTRSWVSSCAEVLNAVGSNVTAGSARVTPGGFEYTTSESASAEFNPILYWAIAPKSDAPGFFRII